MENHYRLGIDIGGTFTDILLMNEVTGELKLLKVPTTRWPVEAVIAGIEVLHKQYQVEPSEIGYFSHGTTLALNTLLQRSGVPVGMLTTKGFRDILELRRLRLPKTNDLLVARPISLVPRNHVREVDERILANGQIYVPIRQEDVIEQASQLVAAGIQSLTICFLHSYRNPVHEQLAKQWIKKQFPDLYVCSSSEIWPQQREYERSLISVMNAHVGKQMQAYFYSLDDQLNQLGLRCRIFSTKSNGGVMSARTASERPVETMLSGPAAGVIGAAYVGNLIQDKQIVTLDMGGTSVDIAVIQGEIPYSTENTVGDFPVIMPAVDVSSIGAGGGSIAWLDRDSVLKVGPQSSGANPGPACYGRGGVMPTVTDAYLTVGILNPDNFLGGQMKLDPSLAREAINSIGNKLNLDPYQTSDAILKVATSKIYAELLPQMARRGADPRDFSILAFGGAGPTHVFMLARDLHIRRVIIPPTPGLLCALGCLVADLRSDFVASIWKECDLITDDELNGIYRQLELKAREWLAGESVELEQIYFIRSADMCYTGQSFEVNVRFPIVNEFDFSVSQMERFFFDQYERVYGYADRNARVRLLDSRVQIVGVTPKPTLKIIHQPSKVLNSREHVRSIYDSGSFVKAKIFKRETLETGWETDGFAVIEQYDSTIYVPEGFHVYVDSQLNIIGERLP
jgi:N-methylhydantoinase A